MELAKIEQMLEAYFEGNTSLQEEQELRSFFAKEDVPSHLEMYHSMFHGWEVAKMETSTRPLSISEEKHESTSRSRKSNFWKLGVAASIVAIIGVGSYFYNDNGLSADEEEALAAFKQTKEVMYLFSAQLNEGTEAVAHLESFNEGVSAMSFINQLNESKKLILK